MKTFYSKTQQALVVAITLVLFSAIIFFDISTIIIYTMSFLVLLEAVRTIFDFILNDKHHIRLRYVIDGAILFGIRELFVGWVMMKNSFQSGVMLSAASFILILGLIIVRIILMKNSPDFLEKK